MGTVDAGVQVANAWCICRGRRNAPSKLLHELRLISWRKGDKLPRENLGKPQFRENVEDIFDGCQLLECRSGKKNSALGEPDYL